MTSMLTQTQLRKEIIQTVDKVADLLRPCLGPTGRNCAFHYQDIHKKWHDACTSSSDLLLDALELEPGSAQALIHSLVREGLITKAAQDGVATSYILLQAMLHEGARLIESGMEPMELKKGIEDGIHTAVQFVFNQTAPANEITQLWAVAKTASADDEIADWIARAFLKVGINGQITVEESKGVEVVLEHTNAFELPYGYNSPEFCAGGTQSEVTFPNPYLLMTDIVVSDFHDLLPVIQQVFSAHGQLAVLAPSVEGNALLGFIQNNRAGKFRSVCIDIKGLDYRRRDNLRDLAAYTGGTFITADLGMRLRDVRLEHLGRADEVTVSAQRILISGRRGTDEDISRQQHEAEVMLHNSRNETEAERHRTRISNLTGGIAVLRVGGPTELEMREKKLRFDKALTAAGAALEYGVVPGGGSIYLMASQAVRAQGDRLQDHERQAGIALVSRALEAPMRQLAENAGLPGNFWVNKIRDAGNGMCLCLDTQEITSAQEHRILDATAVVCHAICQAGSLAASLLTLDRLCAAPAPLRIPRKKRPL